MKRCGRWSLGLGLALLAFGGAFATEPVTMEGEFVWQRSDGESNGDVTAIFTPAGTDGEWEVAFHFQWEDGPHIYKGTASGDLKTGELMGEVENDNEERPASFRFNGNFSDGEFSGMHGVIQNDGSLQDTGTLSLRPVS